MPRARSDINWDAVKVIWLGGQHTSEELGAMFGISADAIRGRAFREHWNDLKRIKQHKTAVLQVSSRGTIAVIPQRNRPKSGEAPGPGLIPQESGRTS